MIVFDCRRRESQAVRAARGRCCTFPREVASSALHARSSRPWSRWRVGSAFAELLGAMTFLPDEKLGIRGEPLHRVVGDEVFIVMPDSRMHWLRNATARTV